MRNMLPKCLGFSNSEKQPATQIEELCRRFSLAQLRKATNNFDKSRIIGVGGFGTIYKGCILVNGEAKEVAIRRSDEKFRQSTDLCGRSKKEIVLLCQLRHHNLLSLIGFCEEKSELILVFEYLPNGALRDKIHGDDKNERMSSLSWKKRLEICIGTARGLHYLHTGVKRTIIHCNMKPSHILLDENCVPKIASFLGSLRGPTSTSKHPKPKQVDRICGTYGYIAPEYAIYRFVTEKVDVFSFGMILLEVACAIKPPMIAEEMTKYVDLNDDDSQEERDNESSVSFFNLAKKISYLLHKKKADEIIDPSLKGKISPKCLELFLGIAERCLQKEATKRPHMGEVEMELELALRFQEEADTNLSSDSENSIISSTAGSSSQPLEAHSCGIATHRN